MNPFQKILKENEVQSYKIMINSLMDSYDPQTAATNFPFLKTIQDISQSLKTLAKMSYCDLKIIV